MSDQPFKPLSKPAPKARMSISTFLESIPPGQETIIKEPIQDHEVSRGIALNVPPFIFLPTIQLYCSTEKCNGVRFFEPNTVKWSINPKEPSLLKFRCKNCEETEKLYAIIYSIHEKAICVMKIGEHPPYGPPVPTRVISLIGPDRDNFLKGRRSENQGLGIGAFAYYRRIVERHKDRIFGELISACKKLGASVEVIQDLETAKKEIQFTRAVESMKHGLPSTLLINGQHNPLILLHSALSEGLHDHSDEECLELAQNIRVVLTDMAERVAQALKEVSELDSAVANLMKRGSQKKPSESSARVKPPPP